MIRFARPKLEPAEHYLPPLFGFDLQPFLGCDNWFLTHTFARSWTEPGTAWPARAAEAANAEPRPCSRVAPPLPAPFDSQARCARPPEGPGWACGGRPREYGRRVQVRRPRFVLALVVLALPVASPSALPVTLLVALRLAVALLPLVCTGVSGE